MSNSNSKLNTIILAALTGLISVFLVMVGWLGNRAQNSLDGLNVKVDAISSIVGRHDTLIPIIQGDIDSLKKKTDISITRVEFSHFKEQLVPKVGRLAPTPN